MYHHDHHRRAQASSLVILSADSSYLPLNISKVSNFCGSTKDGGMVHVKLELKRVGRCVCMNSTNATLMLHFVNVLEDCTSLLLTDKMQDMLL